MKELLKLDVRILGKSQQATINGGQYPECPPPDPTKPCFPTHDEDECC